MNNLHLSDSDQWLTWPELRAKHIRREKRWRAVTNVLLVLGLVGAAVLWWFAWEMR